jgi:uncharacterized membrane protein
MFSAAHTWVRAASEVDPSAFLQYGAVGLVAALAICGLIYVNRRREESWEAAREQFLDQARIDRETFREQLRAANERADDERRRADRAQEELANMIKAVQGDAMRAVSEANRAVTDALRRTQP